jgi:hypothetical protein
MADAPIFENWNSTHGALWGRHPLHLQHRLHAMPLFSREALAELIDCYPRSHYGLVHMGASKDRRFWREGEIGDVRGEDVIDAIASGRMWLNLRNVDTVDARYRELLDSIFGELSDRVPGFTGDKATCGLLISSPNAQVYYHCDLPGQHLWQIEGRKKVYVYPSAPPFVSPENLEDIALFDVEVDMPYESWFDDYAQVFELAPGHMLSWPLNAPHRVENLDCLNVSMTVSFSSGPISRLQKVNLANGLLRHRFGYASKGRAITGPAYWSKAALQKAFRDSTWVKRERATRRAVDFRLDPLRLGQIVEIPAVR